ncbi:hypothetical protein J4230_03745 [Candidatus Woesearchaeota archaeon]|nr:hypothetical protein [Candidatus Woesearchaeota archaeon]
MKSKFKGKLLVNLPKHNPNIDILRGNFGREFLAEYNGRVRDKYRNNSILRVLSESNGLVKGSNSFAVVLANEILAQEGLRTATQADLELILRYRPDLKLRENYEDIGLVLRSEGIQIVILQEI